MTLAALFPGQGSQYVGMGADLFEASPDLLGERADEILGWSLRGICLEGPEETLTRTEYAQPAIFALSFALWDLLSAEGITVSAAAGHSLGEYTALAAAGAFSYEAALSLVAARGRAMAAAADVEPSGMAALLGADESVAAGVVSANRDQGGRLAVANINAPGQIVVAGSREDITWVSENAGALGVRRGVPLNVAGAFHSSFMEPASLEVAAALDGIEPAGLAFPVWSNTSAQPHLLEGLEEMLVSQVVSPVRFGESLVSMGQAGIDTFVHVGPGDVTAGMARRCVPEARVLVVSAIDHIPAAIDALGTIATDQE